MTDRTAEAVWSGGIRDGQGHVTLGSEAWKGEYSFKSRFGGAEETKSNPEELVAAGLASCVSMAVANQLQQQVGTPETVDTTVECPIEMDREMGPNIPQVDIVTEIDMPDADPDRVTRIARSAQEACPVSRLLGDVDLTLDAELVT